MPNLLDYLCWRGDLLLSERPFCEADSAVLARVSYLPFQALELKETDALSLGEAADRLCALPDVDARIVLSGDRRMLRALASSPRFRSMTLTGFRSVFDAEKETQFCAMTLVLGDGRRYVSYRGTDNTLVGWKENLNMSFTCPVPAQMLAVAYLRERTAPFCWAVTPRAGTSPSTPVPSAARRSRTGSKRSGTSTGRASTGRCWRSPSTNGSAPASVR